MRKGSPTFGKYVAVELSDENKRQFFIPHIPIEARIIGIADAFDAMTANRVYRKQLDIDYVTNELKRCSGTQFDPKLVKIMLSLMDEGIIDVESLYARSKGETEE